MDTLIYQAQVGSDRFQALELGGEVRLSNIDAGLNSFLKLGIRVYTPKACARRAYQAVRSLPFLQSLEPRQAIWLLQKVRLIRYETDQRIFSQGDKVEDMYVVAS